MKKAGMLSEIPPEARQKAWPEIKEAKAEQPAPRCPDCGGKLIYSFFRRLLRDQCSLPISLAAASRISRHSRSVTSPVGPSTMTRQRGWVPL